MKVVTVSVILGNLLFSPYQKSGLNSEILLTLGNFSGKIEKLHISFIRLTNKFKKLHDSWYKPAAFLKSTFFNDCSTSLRLLPIRGFS